MHADDDRRGALVDASSISRSAGASCDVLLVARVGGGAHPLDVRAGAEALARRPRARPRARRRRRERLAQLGDQRGVEGVPAGRPREGHVEDSRRLSRCGARSRPRSVDCARAEGCDRRRRHAAPRGRGAAGRGRVRAATCDFLARAWTACSRSARPGRGSSSRGGAAARGGAVPRRRPAGDRPLRRPDDRGHGRARGARSGGRRRRGRGDRAAVLPARRRRAARALRRGRRRLRSAAVLRLRVRARERLRRAARRWSSSCASRAEPRRAQGLGRAVGGVRAVPHRGARRLRRPGGADRAGHARVGAVGAVSGARVGVSRARRRRGPRRRRRSGSRGSASCAPRSSAFRATRRSSSIARRSAACRSARTCARRCAG